MERLDEPTWLARRRSHEERVDGWLAPVLERRARGDKDPVSDFLLTYYPHRASRLRRWSPGPGVVLEAHPTDPPWTAVEGGAALGSPSPALVSRAGAIADRLAAVASRPPSFGCFGLHEWAMVHRSPEVRHPQLPLRLGAAGTDAVVEAMPLTCTHFDAFRFFTPTARPRNDVELTPADRVARDQPGCLHAGMDLYDLASRIAPHVASELVADCFAHAREARLLDVRASPYDVSSLGLTAVAVETERGREEYVAAQRALAARGAVLRGRLLDALAVLLPEPGAAADGPDAVVGPDGVDGA